MYQLHITDFFYGYLANYKKWFRVGDCTGLTNVKERPCILLDEAVFLDGLVSEEQDHNVNL